MQSGEETYKEKEKGKDKFDKVFTHWKNKLKTWLSYVFSVIKGLFSNIILVTLFKYCENICEWKSVMEIGIVLFK